MDRSVFLQKHITYYFFTRVGAWIVIFIRILKIYVLGRRVIVRLLVTTLFKINTPFQGNYFTAFSLFPSPVGESSKFSVVIKVSLHAVSFHQRDLMPIPIVPFRDYG